MVEMHLSRAFGGSIGWGSTTSKDASDYQNQCQKNNTTAMHNAPCFAFFRFYG
jgi:hypothetical protein